MGARYGSNYISLVSMLVESAALYSAWALAFLITFARESAIQNLLLPALGQVQVGILRAIYTTVLIRLILQGHRTSSYLDESFGREGMEHY